MELSELVVRRQKGSGACAYEYLRLTVTGIVAQCAGIRIRTAASCLGSGIAAIVPRHRSIREEAVRDQLMSSAGLPFPAGER